MDDSREEAHRTSGEFSLKVLFGSLWLISKPQDGSLSPLTTLDSRCSSPTVIHSASPTTFHGTSSHNIPFRRTRKAPDDSDSESDCSGCSYCRAQGNSDLRLTSNSNPSDSDTSLVQTAARMRGGKKRGLKRSRRQGCNRNGDARLSSRDVVSGIIEGPEGPFIFEGQEESGQGDDVQGGERSELTMSGDAGTIDKELGGEGNRVKGKGVSVKGVKKTRGNRLEVAEWEHILKTATSPTATPLLARLCTMSSHANRNTLHQLVLDLTDAPLAPIQWEPPQRLGEVKLADIVAKIEGTTRSAKINELVRMLAVMNLALQLDQ